MYKIETTKLPDGTDLINIGFIGNETASNKDLVKFVLNQIRNKKMKGGKLILVSGQASLPIMTLIACELKNLYAAIAIYDPKERGFIISHTLKSHFKIGELV